MKKFFGIFITSLILSSTYSNIAKADESPDGILRYIDSKEEKKSYGSKPNFLVMPSTNQNERPNNIKPEIIILHHTAPFSSLNKVGYFFQDINTRVSAHFTVGKEGLIIQSVDEKDRAWHAGPSTWLGKWNVNDYSIGIEIFNDGDGKDPFTEAQNVAVSKLVSYLMKKYNIPLSKVVGHRDIAIPLGRKIDPADNFDWKLIKAKIRRELDLPSSFMGWWELPQESNEKISNVLEKLKSNDIDKRASGLELLFTVPHKNNEKDIETFFNNEKEEKIRARFYKFFEIEENENNLNQANEEIQNYKNNLEVLNINIVNYLVEKNLDNSKTLFLKMFNDKNVTENLKISLIKALGNYKDEKIKLLLKDYLDITKSDNQKKAILESLANYNDKNLNETFFKYIENDYSEDIKIASLDSLRNTLDTTYENKLLSFLPKLSGNIQEFAIWTLLRKDSKNTLSLLIKSDIYENLSQKLKSGIFNTIAKLKYVEAEKFAIKNLNKENNDFLRYSIILALGKISTNNTFNELNKYFSQEQTKETKLVIIKAILESDNKEYISKVIINILKSKNIPYEAKLIALSAIKEKKLIDLIPFLKEVYVESSSEEFNIILKETTSYIENL